MTAARTVAESAGSHPVSTSASAPCAPAVKVSACNPVNTATTLSKPRKPRNGATRQRRNSEAIDGKRVDKTTLHEKPRRLVPARIERDPAEVARNLVAARRLAGGKVVEPQLDPLCRLLAPPLSVSRCRGEAIAASIRSARRRSPGSRRGRYSPATADLRDGRGHSDSSQTNGRKAARVASRVSSARASRHRQRARPVGRSQPRLASAWRLRWPRSRYPGPRFGSEKLASSASGTLTSSWTRPSSGLTNPCRTISGGRSLPLACAQRGKARTARKTIDQKHARNVRSTGVPVIRRSPGQGTRSGSACMGTCALCHVAGEGDRKRRPEASTGAGRRA